MSSVSSNYINSLASVSRYNYTSMKAKSTGQDYGELVYGNRKGYVNSDAVSYLSSISENAKAVASSLKNLGQASTFSKMNAVSSNKDALTISSTTAPTASFESRLVDITQVASGQVNKGTQLRGDSLYTGDSGTQQFEIEIEGKKTQVSVKVESGDTNKAVQEKVADAINSKNLGVTASVGSSGGNTSLTIQSKNAGDSDANRFVIRDMYGNLSDTLGLENVTQSAQDAIYSVDGGADIHSSSNTIDLGDGVKATLKAATNGTPVSVGVSRDESYAVNQVKEFVSNFNSLLDASRSANYNDRLYNDLTNALTSYEKSLSEIGISINKDMSLSVDGSALEAAATSADGKPSTLENFLTNYGSSSSNYGLTGRLSTITANVERNPAHYVSATASSGESDSVESAFTWSDPFDADLSPYTYFNLNTYNQYLSLGYLFDMFV